MGFLKTIYEEIEGSLGLKMREVPYQWVKSCFVYVIIGFETTILMFLDIKKATVVPAAPACYY